jgi:RNA 2',3'-cyclic 3'-phosphodiesterase
VRCFIALSLPPEAREALARSAASCRAELEAGRPHQGPQLSWVRPEGYHLSLAFLGEIEGEALRAAAAALDAAAGSGEIPFSFAGLGSFPPKGAWRVLYARIADEGRSALAFRLVAGALGGQWEFAPHVTLARLRPRGGGGREALPLPAAPCPAGAWTISRCSLYKSELKSSGSVYTELRGVELSPR